ncbi:ATP-binding protein, partial [Aliarcobacter butzleri]|uniref:ATP-binding protein n=1 Tax=Aliarcobacter butzleri TaxID=28197 RepID=UPI00396B0A62
EKLIRELATLSFLDSATNVLLVGAPGVGKTHLSIALVHTPEQFGQPADLHPDTLPELIRTASRFIFGQF